MSQTAVMVRVNGNLFSEVFSSVPTFEDAIQICKDFGYESTDADYDGDYINVEYEWIEIGEGESGTDSFYDDETLCHIYDQYCWDEVFEEQGYSTEIVTSGSYEVEFSDLEEV